MQNAKKKSFTLFLKKEIGIKDESILAKIDEGVFLPKQISAENCDIPYQVHLAELKAILANAENYFPFLKQKDENCEMTVSEKNNFAHEIPCALLCGTVHRQRNRLQLDDKKGGVKYAKNYALEL